ncbi:MAG: hypothetical protein J6Y91_05085 [Alphaproteobacteria bacterium]|nr:hypothetical protein [Alphaproteobacteria bacterium]
MDNVEILTASEESHSVASGVLSFFVGIKDSVNQFIENFSLSGIFSSLIVRYNRFHQAVEMEFGPYGLFILVLFAFFLVLIAFIYAKSVMDTFHAVKQQGTSLVPQEGMLFLTEKSSDETDGEETEEEIVAEYTENDEEADDMYAEQNEMSETDNYEEYEYVDEYPDENATDNVQTEEKVAVPKRVMAQIEKDEELSAAVIAASSATQSPTSHLSDDYMHLKSVMKRHADDEKYRFEQIKSQNERMGEELAQALKVEATNNISNMITLLLNLLGRNVSEQKIVQILYQKFAPLFNEANILQIVCGIRDFIGLCNSGRLDFIPDRRTLPQNDQALYALSRGDTTPCLILLQSFLNMQMEKAETETGVIKEITYAQAANSSCIMGNLAYLDDKPLAHNAFELATELSPKSVTAWNRLADIYVEENLTDKAMIAYQCVIDYGDEIMYPEQLANARNQLADYYEKMGMADRSEQYRTQSMSFYQNYGMLSKLTQTEDEALSLIAENSDVRESIRVLLPSQTTYSL